MESKIVLGFKLFDIDYIELERGLVKQTTNIIGLSSEKSVFEEVFLNGSDNDFNKLLEELSKKSLQEKEDWISFILTAQNGWTKRDQKVIDFLYTEDCNLFKIVQKSFKILIFNSEKTYKKEKRLENLKSRKTGLARKELNLSLTRNSVFKRELDIMLNYLEKAFPNQDLSIYTMYKVKTVDEILNSSIIKEFAEENYIKM